MDKKFNYRSTPWLSFWGGNTFCKAVGGLVSPPREKGKNGSAKERRKFAKGSWFMKTVEIKIWMLRNDVRQAQVAADLGVSRPLVSMTIHGMAKNRRVLDWLKNHGCPEEYLEFPKRKTP